jgi:hypothetical protein
VKQGPAFVFARVILACSGHGHRGQHKTGRGGADHDFLGHRLISRFDFSRLVLRQVLEGNPAFGPAF